MRDYEIYQVGGSVRDELLGIKSKDIDYAVECRNFNHLREIILNMGGKIFLETPKFFTIRANVPELGATDFVMTRKDSSSSVDGRHPDYVEAGTIFDDQSRRDFGCNSLAKNVFTGEILDPFNGRQDIIDGVIRAVGDPDKRLSEDRLRALRALRFSITKNMEIEYNLKRAIVNLDVQDFHAVSTERVREELFKMFQYDSFRSFELIYNQYFTIVELIKERNIWFKPTTEQK